MAFYKEKFKRIGDKTSPCFKPFLIGNMTDKYLSKRTMLFLSLRHIFISHTTLMGIPNWMRKVYNSYFLTDLQVCLKAIRENSWCTGTLNCHFFSSIWRKQNVWSVIDMLRRIPHLWFPVISFVYGVKLGSTTLDCILYVADKEMCA